MSNEDVKISKKDLEIDNILKFSGILDACVDSQKSIKQLRAEKMKKINKI